MNDFKRVEVVTNALNEVKDHLQKLSMAWKVRKKKKKKKIKNKNK